MTVAIMKTKAEQSLVAAFDAALARLPGSAAAAGLRRAAIGRFATHGLPHRRLEPWKYTDLRALMKDADPLALGADRPVGAGEIDAALGPMTEIDCHHIVLVDGQVRADLGRFSAPKGVEVLSLAAVLAKASDPIVAGLMGTSAPEAETVVALNTALLTDGTIVRIADNARFSKPLHIVNVRALGAAHTIATRTIVTVGQRAEATIIETHIALGNAGGGQTNSATEITVGAGAVVDHVKVTSERGATHLASWMIALGAASTYRAFQFTAGPALARNQSFVTFAGEGAKLDLSGVFLARGTEHVDSTLVIDHAVPACESRELFRGVLDGRARGIVQGKVIVRPDAQKTDGKQMAQALMLSPDAEFDSKPELEIYADDVVCGHGSTCAELDAGLMFYLMARGIPRAEARAMLIESFVAEALDKVRHDGLRAALASIARAWLRSLTPMGA